MTHPGASVSPAPPFPEVIMAGWYVLSENAKGGFSFVLKAGNGETILRSETYNTRASADNGIASVRKNSADDARYEKKTAANGKEFFNLKATNGQVIGTSEMYSSAASRDAGIEAVKVNGPSMTVKPAEASPVT
jgi:uncharacterized protein YegP (UPF0339 family)